MAVRAVVMAGGEGTRLRPMTANQPKPLLPVVNQPIMGHVLRLLRRHGVTETVVTLQFLASLVRNYFGDGDEFGMTLSYATEETPLGTAGSVKNAEAALKDEPFIVISGDALTDIDLTDMIEFHRRNKALVTIALKRVADPVEFGIIIADEEGRIERFLEKPTWGQVFSDTVNTGVYIMEPEVLDHVATGTSVDWSNDVFPKLLADGAPLYGYVTEAYWEDVGTHESYLRVQADVLNRLVDVEIDGFEVSSGVWIAEGAEVDPDATLRGPLYVGDYAKVEAGAELREYTVLGSNVVVKTGAFLHRAVLHDNVFCGPATHLRGAVIGKNTDLMRGARVEEGAIIGDECVVEEEAFISAGVKIYPFKTIEAGAVVNTSVIWESRGSRSLFGPRGVSGLVNVEITPEHVVRLASAYATSLRKGSTVTTSRDASRAARTLKRAAISALTASAINVRDLEVAPTPVTRFEVAAGDAVGGIMIRTTPGDPQSVDIVFLDERGADLSRAAQRKLERTFSRQEFRRAFPGEIADLTFPARTLDTYVQEMLSSVDITGIREARMKVVLDTAGGTAALVLPLILGRLGVDVLTMNGRLDETSTTETLAEHMRDLERLGELVASSKASFGVRFDHVGERLSIVDERGDLVHDDRALLVFLDLVAAESRGGRVALPVTTTRVAEQVARFHGVDIEWASTAPEQLTATATDEGVVFAGDGRGGFVIPEFHSALDGLAAFVRLLGLVARTKLTLSEIDARIPDASLVRRTVPTPWATKGQVMRAVVEAAHGREVDTTDGVRVIEPDGEWAMVLPDPLEAVTHLWAEAWDPDRALVLLDTWAAVVEAASS
ncbi:mannose-1-phosphate guanyltransferase [Acidothermaceae bacterium B102]|nr:mannose-1-phosphate guanyltransferase [Acidothermaceae bacterium B102]